MKDKKFFVLSEWGEAILLGLIFLLGLGFLGIPTHFFIKMRDSYESRFAKYEEIISSNFDRLEHRILKAEAQDTTKPKLSARKLKTPSVITETERIQRQNEYQ